MNRNARLARIAKMIASRRIPSQQDLRNLLKRAGIALSQASLSRDLKHLGARRVRDPDGEYHYALPDPAPVAVSSQSMRRRFAESVTEVRRCQFLVLVLTPPGEAPRAGEVLDHMGLPELSGTVAGDDTLLCVAADTARAKRLEKRLKEMIG